MTKRRRRQDHSKHSATASMNDNQHGSNGINNKSQYIQRQTPKNGQTNIEQESSENGHDWKQSIMQVISLKK